MTAQGIKLPLQAEAGRLKLLTGDSYVEQIIAVALGDGTSTNPFQDLGLGEFMIFDINDSLSSGEIKDKAKRIFASLERSQLAKLESINFTEEGAEKFAEITYKNLETGSRTSFELPVSSGV